MSGSPVFAFYNGLWNPSGGSSIQSDTAIGTDTEFIGCYSGRVPTLQHEAALGICWRKDVIDLICETKQRGQHPDQSGKPLL